MKALKVICLTFAVTGVMFGGLVVGSHTNTRAASARLATAPGGPNFSPDHATSAARLTEGQVKTVVRNEFGPGLLEHPFSIAYGAFTDNRYQRRTVAGEHPVGTIDGWMVTVTGLQIPRSCPKFAQSTCAPVQTLQVVVDDKAGSFPEAIGT